PEFAPTVDAGTRKALADFSTTDGAKVARDLDGKTLDEVKQYMDTNYPSAPKTVSNLNPPPGQTEAVVQTKWELADGTVVRVKETNPPGAKVDRFRQEPALSVTSRKRDPSGQPLPESYQNEAFKISKDGVPVPKGPNEINTDGLTPAQARQRIDDMMNAGHRSISR
ncbi:MAG TPA: hypothetical protein VFO41_01975, partial [Alphaproteobacteria bacterium]|nr:hypothetical protein [Alphaproteobacteria bacterium]